MKVCIIGSGLSALTLAKALVNEKIYVDILYSKKSNKNNKSRTIGISKSNLEYFNKNIINLNKIIWKIKKIEIFSDNLKNEKILNFENNKHYLFSNIKNFKLYNLLSRSLSNNKYVKIIKIKKKQKNIKKYDLIINTDYSNFLTQKYFNKKIVKKYNSFAYTTTIQHKQLLNDVATQIFTKKGPLAFLPISKTKTSVVYSIHNQKKNQKVNIVDLIKKYNFNYKILKIEDLDSFELKSLTLRSYYHSNILAFGDLIHKIHPLAGQGFNMTIRDTKFLLEIIKKNIDLGLPLDTTINNKFEKKRKHANYIFSNGIDFIHEFFNFERKFKNSFLSKSVKLLGSNQLLTKYFTKVADKGLTF